MFVYIIIIIYSIITDGVGEEPLVWHGKMKSKETTEAIDLLYSCLLRTTETDAIVAIYYLLVNWSGAWSRDRSGGSRRDPETDGALSISKPLATNASVNRRFLSVAVKTAVCTNR